MAVTFIFGSQEQHGATWSWLESTLSTLFSALWVLPLIFISRIVTALWFQVSYHWKKIVFMYNWQIIYIGYSRYFIQRQTTSFQKHFKINRWYIVQHVDTDFIFDTGLIIELINLIKFNHIVALHRPIYSIFFRLDLSVKFWVFYIQAFYTHFIHLNINGSIWVRSKKKSKLKKKWKSICLFKNTGWELYKRLHYIERMWPYFFGFGLPLALVTHSLPNYYLNTACFAFLFPLFILSANETHLDLKKR